MSLHLPRAELLICTSLSAGLTNVTRQLGALGAGKRRDHLASLSGFCENVTFHQAAIYRLLLLLLPLLLPLREKKKKTVSLQEEESREKRWLKHKHA